MLPLKSGALIDAAEAYSVSCMRMRVVTRVFRSSLAYNKRRAFFDLVGLRDL